MKLWHREFWMLSFANLLITLAVYVQLPLLPVWLKAGAGASELQVGLAMGAYGVGLFVLGPLCNWLVQSFRRHHVCTRFIMLMIVTFAAMMLVQQYYRVWGLSVGVMIALRAVLGALFGMVQMVLCSTLIIDTSESFQRTEANYAAAWFSRFAIALGPGLGLIISHHTASTVRGYWLSMALAVGAIVLIDLIKFPFKAPDEDIRHFSTDRFLLRKSAWLFLFLFVVMAVVGMLLSVQHRPVFYVQLMIGLFLAILAGNFVFQNADLKSEPVVALLSIGASVLIMLHRTASSAGYVAPVLLGLGVGLMGSRFILFFIKLSKHCQRGTSQSSFFLAWESGIAFGLFMGYAFFVDKRAVLLYCCVGAIAVALLMYNFIVHPWYMKNKNR